MVVLLHKEFTDTLVWFLSLLCQALSLSSYDSFFPFSVTRGIFTRKKMLAGDLPEPQNSGHELGFVVFLPGPRYIHWASGDTRREGIPGKARSAVVWLVSSGWSQRVTGGLPDKGYQLVQAGRRPHGHLHSFLWGFHFSKLCAWLSDFTFSFHFHALEKEMATHSSVLAWRIPGTGEPGGLPSMGSHRVRHDWSDLAAAAEAFYSSPHFCSWSQNRPQNWNLREKMKKKGIFRLNFRYICYRIFASWLLKAAEFVLGFSPGKRGIPGQHLYFCFPPHWGKGQVGFQKTLCGPRFSPHSPHTPRNFPGFLHLSRNHVKSKRTFHLGATT